MAIWASPLFFILKTSIPSYLLIKIIIGTISYAFLFSFLYYFFAASILAEMLRAQKFTLPKKSMRSSKFQSSEIEMKLMILEDLSARVGLYQQLDTYLIDCDQLILVSLGPKGSKKIFISLSVLNRFSKEQLEGLFLNELSAIKNGSQFTLQWAWGFLCSLIFFPLDCLSWVFKLDQTKNPELRQSILRLRFALFNILYLLFGFLPLALYNTFSRIKSYNADQYVQKSLRSGNYLEVFQSFIQDEGRAINKRDLLDAKTCFLFTLHSIVNYNELKKNKFKVGHVELDRRFDALKEFS